MLTLRRISNIYQYIYSFSSYQYRYKSKRTTNDESRNKTPSFKEEIRDFERKDTKIPRNLSQNKKYSSKDNQIERSQPISRETLSSNDDGHQKAEIPLRNFNMRDVNRRKKSFDESSRSNFNQSFDSIDKNKKGEGERTDPKQKKKSRPHVILDTESDEVKILTRQVADSLTPANSPQDSSNIEQELLDVLRGHRVVSKIARRMEKKAEVISKDSGEEKQFDRKTETKTRTNVNVDGEKSTEAFSSLLRDIKLKPTMGMMKSETEEDFIRDAIDGSMVRPRFSDDREQKRDSIGSRKPMRDTRRRQEFLRPYQLWSGEPLGIFTANDSKDQSLAVFPIWDKYEQEELTRISSIPPRNAFEEMIQWTKDGILWKFPIDNEQDIGPEADAPFYDHVLLERHLHDFPKSPLIRQFMELVCVGLGRNPYWTVEQKLEHIDWFRKFFNDKMNVFHETVHTGEIRTSASPPVAKPVSTYKPKPASPPAPPKVVPVVTPPPAATKTPTASKK